MNIDTPLSYEKKNYIARRQPSCSFPSCFVHLTLEMQKSFLPSPIFRSRPTPFFLFSCSACSPFEFPLTPSSHLLSSGKEGRRPARPTKKSIWNVPRQKAPNKYSSWCDVVHILWRNISNWVLLHPDRLQQLAPLFGSIYFLSMTGKDRSQGTQDGDCSVMQYHIVRLPMTWYLAISAMINEHVIQSPSIFESHPLMSLPCFTAEGLQILLPSFSKLVPRKNKRTINLIYDISDRVFH